MQRSEKTEFRTVSSRAKSLLARTEGLDVDFKRSASGVDSEDFVAFANSARGGAILVGVDETTNSQGLQRGVVVGCDVGDRPKQILLNRAASCVPAVHVQVFIENTARKPFFRVEILPSRRRPHSTGGGTYKIRGDAITRSLQPNELLVMFLEAEEESFIGRFRAATKELGDGLKSLRSSTQAETEHLVDTIRMFSRDTLDYLGQVGASAEEAHVFSEEAQCASITAVEHLEELRTDFARHQKDLERADDALIAIGEAIGVDVEVPRLKEQVVFVARLPFPPTVDDIYGELLKTSAAVKDGRVTREHIEQWCEEVKEARARNTAVG